MAARGVIKVNMHEVRLGEPQAVSDLLAVEEPLEIQLSFETPTRRIVQSIAITMRTPGEPEDDFNLAVGFLLAENVIRDTADVRRVISCGTPLADGATRNIVRVDLAAGVEVKLERLERRFYTTSSCGVCGKTSIEALEATTFNSLAKCELTVSAATIHLLPAKLRERQAIFNSTGGLHAAALFDADGEVLRVCEDVGRHNALDKLIGAELRRARVPLSKNMILVSGRVSFELVQKTLAAGAPVLAAVGAPSSLAVELAQSAGLTMLGFVRASKFNIYAGAWRIREIGAAATSAASVPTTCVQVEVLR